MNHEQPIQRYEMDSDYPAIEDPNGEWVKYEDVARAVPVEPHEHRPEVHLCNPPAGDPYMIICGECSVVMWGSVTPEQAATPDVHESLTPETLAAYRGSAVPVEGDRERLARIIDVALADAAQHNGSYDWDWYAEPEVYNRIADHLIGAGVSLTGREALLLAVEEVDNAWHDEGDHIEYHEELAERLITLRHEYAALSGESGEPKENERG